MTYRQLLQALKSMPYELLDDHATVEFDGEFYQVSGIASNENDDVLDAGHQVLVIK